MFALLYEYGTTTVPLR